MGGRARIGGSPEIAAGFRCAGEQHGRGMKLAAGLGPQREGEGRRGAGSCKRWRAGPGSVGVGRALRAGRRAVCGAWTERGVRRRAGGSGQAGPCGGKEGSGPLRAGPEKEVGRGGGRKTADRAGPRSRVGLLGFRDGVWVGSSLPFLFYFFPLFYF